MQAGLERYKYTMWSWKGHPIVFLLGNKFPQEVQDRIMSSNIFTEAISEDIKKLTALGFVEYLSVDYDDDHVHIKFKSQISNIVTAHLWIADNIHWYIAVRGCNQTLCSDAFSKAVNCLSRR